MKSEPVPPREGTRPATCRPGPQTRHTLAPQIDAPDIDWLALDRLRQAFLSGAAGEADYWKADGNLGSYDATFAQRIGWKWDHVLTELRQRGWSPPPGDVLDWGCGSGIAGRAFLDQYGTAGVTTLRLWDRSSRAMDWAAARARARYPNLPLTVGPQPPPALLLISHVLTELNPEQTELLMKLVSEAQAVLWVEPGTYEVSRTLMALRERLRERFHLLGPCPHRERCGMLAPGNERHWCHHFAEVPPSVFTDSFWGKFADLAGVDLRSLPLSWLALDARPAPAFPEDTRRVIGRPRVYKGHALVLACDAAGVRDRTLTKRRLPEAFREIKKEEFASLQAWSEAGGQVIRTRPALA